MLVFCKGSSLCYFFVDINWGRFCLWDEVFLFGLVVLIMDCGWWIWWGYLGFCWDFNMFMFFSDRVFRLCWFLLLWILWNFFFGNLMMVCGLFYCFVWFNVRIGGVLIIILLCLFMILFNLEGFVFNYIFMCWIFFFDCWWLLFLLL